MKLKYDYKERLQQVKEYLRTSYANTIEIEALETLSHFSYRNLQRIFKGYYGETVGAHVTRLKVESCAKLVLFSKLTITEIAYEVGYSDVQALSKAFKKHFGISPSVYRERKEELLFKQKIQSKEMTFVQDRVEVLPAKKVMFMTYKGSYDSEEIEELWKKIDQLAVEKQIDTSVLESFGIIWDEPIITEDIKCNYDACIVIPENTSDLKKYQIKEVPSQKYAVFTHVGSYKTISETYDKIFGQWIFQTDQEIGITPFLEFYTKHHSHTDDENAFETEIFVPLKE